MEMALNFEFFYQWVQTKLCVNLSAYKEKQMQRRIQNIMENENVRTLEDYAKLMERDREAKQRFLEHITINVTEFYRNKELFDLFEKHLIRLSKENRNLKIWSAACSIGAEPYTLAMLLKKNNLRASQLIATDIDQTILMKAREGIYKDSEIRNMPSNEKQLYFTKDEKMLYHLSPEIKRMVMFKKHDLLKDRYESNCNIIVCRNVTIYFKNDARDEVYQKFADALVPGGILFTGATETINYCENFGLRKIDSFIYEKMA